MYLNAILVFLGLLLLIYLIYYVGFYRDWLYGCSGKISFESFKALYAMYPDQWSLWDGYVEYTKYQDNGTLLDTRISGRLGFNQIDAIKYQIWYKKLEKQRERESMVSNYQDLLNSFQDDINAYKERNNVK